MKYKYKGPYPGDTDGIGPAKPGDILDLNEDQAKIADKSDFFEKVKESKKGGSKK